MSVIRSDLTFTVLNLYPTYDYPGKIKRVTTTVDGAAQEDKTLTVEIEITPFTTNSSANSLSARIMSPVSTSAKVATYFDMHFTPVNSEHTIFRSTQVLSKHLRSGYWQMPNIRITSTTGIERYESSLLYGFKCYLNNSLEDIIVPTVRPNTSSITVKSGVVDGHPVQIATVKFDVTENTGLAYYYAALVPETAHSLEMYGSGAMSGEGTRTIDFYIKEYAPSGRYTLNQIALKDYGLNLNYTYFNTSGGNSDGTTVNLDETAPSIMIVTPNPDSIAPELDVNRITVSAVPTNLTTPDGETLVTINYFVRDNISGYGGYSSLSLRDPQGVEHSYPTRHRNSGTEYFDGDPTVWAQYTEEVILPRGSIPGIWGLSQIKLTDKAGQSKAYSFTEIIRFDPYSSASARSITETSAPATIISTPSPVYTAPQVQSSTPSPVYTAPQVQSSTPFAVTTVSTTQTVIIGHDVAVFAKEVTGSGHWQTSTNQGISWQNITDSEQYSGVASNLLEILKVSVDFNNNQYRFIADNNTISAITTLSVSLGYFVFPTVIVSDLKGNLYVGDETALTIKKISNFNLVTLVQYITILDPSDKTSDLTRHVSGAGSVSSTAQDLNGNVFTTDTNNHVVYKTSTGGITTILAGESGVAGFTDGTGSAAHFNTPTGLAIDNDGNIYVTDTKNSTIRKITPEGLVTTLAGLPGIDGLMDGSEGYAWFAFPEGITFNVDGNLYVADTGNAVIRKVTLTGIVTTLFLTEEITVTSTTVNTPPTVTSTTSPEQSRTSLTTTTTNSSKGGGGAPSLWFFAAIGLLLISHRKYVLYSLMRGS